MKQSLAIFVVLILGIIFPQGHQLTYLIRYNLMVMLVFAFVQIKFRRDLVQLQHLWIVLCNLALGLFAYAATRWLGPTISMAAFCVCIAPTAAAAPVIAVFLRTRIDFVTISVLMTSPAIAAVLPFLLPQLLEVDQPIAVLDVMLPIAMIVGVPLLLSYLLKQVGPVATKWIQRYKTIPFYLFLANIWVASGRATYFIRYETNGQYSELWIIGLVVAILCLLNFKLGEWILGKEAAYAGGLSLGRKNSMFVLWLALTFVNPMAALGPIFYILYQNIYNGIQIYQVEKKNRLSTFNDLNPLQ
ncbi:MAG: hypothetical protein AAF990_06250 [Bacteroidota bacterium]